MKVLLCSPCLQKPGVITGGINVWANNLLKYQEQTTSDVNVIPVSFDRNSYVDADTNFIKRVYLGVKDFSVSIREAKHVMDTQHVDVIHVCTSASFGLLKDILLLKAARKRGIKSAIHFHFGRIPVLREKKNWEWKLLKKAVSLATTAITMDLKSYNTLTNCGVANVAYCPNPLSLEIINQIENDKPNVKRVPNKIVYIGHVIPTKGVYELVEACKQIDGIDLHIIGRTDPSIKAELETIASTKAKGAWIKFRGEISHDQVIRELLSASIFVLPSYTEGFPNVILEAMACETPIVSTTVGAIPEMLNIAEEFNCGLCVPPRDVNSFRDAVKTFIDDEEYAMRSAHRSLKRVHELYAVPKVWEQLVRIWKK